jgi:hypothetical protein
MSISKAFFPCALLLTWAIAPRLAAASPNFPDEIASALSTPCVPQCTLCHTTNLGGWGTAHTRFVAAMSVKGKLLPEEGSSVAPALAALEDQRIDSDSDGTPDVDELRQGSNPNGDSVDLCSDVGYGCARTAPHGSPPGVSVAVVVLALAWRARRLRVVSAR